MTKVVVQNGNIDLALKKFKAKVARSGVPSELKKRKHYEKPGVRRRNEIKEGINLVLEEEMKLKKELKILIKRIGANNERKN